MGRDRIETGRQARDRAFCGWWVRPSISRRASFSIFHITFFIRHCRKAQFRQWRMKNVIWKMENDYTREFCVAAHSCLSASTGSRREARIAGYSPKINPTPADTPNDMAIEFQVTKVFHSA